MAWQNFNFRVTSFFPHNTILLLSPHHLTFPVSLVSWCLPKELPIGLMRPITNTLPWKNFIQKPWLNFLSTIGKIQRHTHAQPFYQCRQLWTLIRWITSLRTTSFKGLPHCHNHSRTYPWIWESSIYKNESYLQYSSASFQTPQKPGNVLTGIKKTGWPVYTTFSTFNLYLFSTPEKFRPQQKDQPTIC